MEELNLIIERFEDKSGLTPIYPFIDSDLSVAIVLFLCYDPGRNQKNIIKIISAGYCQHGGAVLIVDLKFYPNFEKIITVFDLEKNLSRDYNCHIKSAEPSPP